MNIIAIVGNGKTREDAIYEGREIWTTASVSRALPRADVILEIHRGFAIDELRDRHPKALIYTYDGGGGDIELFASKVGDDFGRNLSGSIAYLLALAINERPDIIELYGIDMASDGEYGTMRENVLYWIGLARGRGINVEISPGSSLEPKRALYGLEKDEKADRLAAELRELSKSLADAETQRIKLRERELYLRGAHDAYAQEYKLMTGGIYVG